MPVIYGRVDRKCVRSALCWTRYVIGEPHRGLILAYLSDYDVSETTAHTLAATLGFLGIHPEIQREVYEEIVQVVGHDRDPVSYQQSSHVVLSTHVAV